MTAQRNYIFGIALRIFSFKAADDISAAHAYYINGTTPSAGVNANSYRYSYLYSCHSLCERAFILNNQLIFTLFSHTCIWNFITTLVHY